MSVWVRLLNVGEILLTGTRWGWRSLCFFSLVRKRLEERSIKAKVEGGKYGKPVGDDRE